MKREKLVIDIAIIAVIVIIIVACFCACLAINTPPTPDEIQEIFNNYEAAIVCTTAFLADLPYESITIDEKSGTMQADLEWMPIPDDISSAVSQLVDIEENVRISKDGNSVHFLLWRGPQDIGCGLVYSINGIDKPQVQFMTELIPLANTGWYYYVADYNEWRCLGS